MEIARYRHRALSFPVVLWVVLAEKALSRPAGGVLVVQPGPYTPKGARRMPAAAPRQSCPSGYCPFALARFGFATGAGVAASR